MTLAGSKPAIWRRFVVPGSITLGRLHEVVQVVMGWTDSHLHSFVADGDFYTAKSRDGVDLEMDGLDESKYRLCDVAPVARNKIQYQYDFGDSWEHTLLVEKIIPVAERPQLYVCLAGANRCPPEDCGGLGGYYYLLEILSDPEHKEHEERMAWIGEKIDPGEFSLEQINKDLKACRF